MSFLVSLLLMKIKIYPLFLQCCASKDDLHEIFNKTSKLFFSLVVLIKLLIHIKWIIITNLTLFIFIFFIISFDYTSPLCWLTNNWWGKGGAVLRVIGDPFEWTCSTLNFKQTKIGALFFVWTFPRFVRLFKAEIAKLTTKWIENKTRNSNFFIK